MHLHAQCGQCACGPAGRCVGRDAGGPLSVAVHQVTEPECPPHNCIHCASDVDPHLCNSPPKNTLHSSQHTAPTPCKKKTHPTLPEVTRCAHTPDERVTSVCCSFGTSCRCTMAASIVGQCRAASATSLARGTWPMFSMSAWGRQSGVEETRQRGERESGTRG